MMYKGEDQWFREAAKLALKGLADDEGIYIYSFINSFSYIIFIYSFTYIIFIQLSQQKGD